MTDDELKDVEKRIQIARMCFGDTFDEGGGREPVDILRDQDRADLHAFVLALLAKEAARGEVAEACPQCQELKPTWIPDAGCWYCSDCCREIDVVDYWQRVPSPEAQD